MHVLTSIVTSSSEHNSRNLYFFFLLEVLFKTRGNRQSPILKTLLKHRLKKMLRLFVSCVVFRSFSSDPSEFQF